MTIRRPPSSILPPLRLFMACFLLCAAVTVFLKQEGCWEKETFVQQHQLRSAEQEVHFNTNHLQPEEATSVSATETAALSGVNHVSRQFLSTIPFGKMGPEGSGSRQKLRYYDLLYVLSIQFAHSAKNVLEVGCASDPFVRHLSWIADKSCLAPYHAYGKKTEHSVTMIEGDFLTWNPSAAAEPPQEGGEREDVKYDLVICGQVLEHVDDPRAFLQKLLRLSHTLLVSVPYKWSQAQTSQKAHHVSHNINEGTIRKWAHPHVPFATAMITDDRPRLIAVFEQKR